MNISLERYRYFHEVAKHLSFSKAASTLFVSQSAVSQAIKQLETTLGYPLFYRHKKKIMLTIDGELLYSYLKQAMSLIASAENKLVNRQDPHHGELIIASTDTLCKYFLLPKIKIFKEMYPHIKIKIYNNTSLENYELLTSAKVDLALMNFPDEIDEDVMTIQKKYTFTDTFVAAKSLNLSKIMTLQDIADETLLMLDADSVTRTHIENLYNKRHIPLNVEFEIQNVHILIEMAKAGLGVTAIPDYCLPEEELQPIKVTSYIPPRHFGILSLSNLPLTSVAKTFLEVL